MFVTLAIGRTALGIISTTPDPGVWGVTNGLVYTIVRAGDVVYLGGDFQQLVSPDGSAVINVNRLAAIDASSGRNSHISRRNHVSGWSI